MNNDWNIKSRNERCALCEKPFADGETLETLLTFEDREGYTRRDVCMDCLDKAKALKPFGAWKTVFRLPPPGKPEPLKKENAETLLRRLIETDDPADWNTIFILAVMLERKRVLLERDVQWNKDEMKVRVYEHKQTGETFAIRDPELKLTELEIVQAEVAVRLGFAEQDASAECAKPAPCGISS